MDHSARKDAMARIQTFVLDRKTPREQRVYLTQGERLVDDPETAPSYKELHRACVIGTRLGRTRKGRRVKCPSRIEPNRRWTTRVAYEWYLEQINGESE